MKQKGYNNVERYHDPERAINRMQRKQEEMLKRHYPEYEKGKYVLWILPELFHTFQSQEISGKICVLTKDGSSTDIPYILRTPYPNKCIYQLSLKSGRKRLYGYPLIFDTFAQLCNICEIQITWDIFTDIYFSEKSKNPYDHRMDQIMVRYKVSFEEHKENRFYTIHTREYIPEIAEKQGDFNSYYEEFDIALEYDNDMIIYEDAPGETIRIELSSLKPVDKDMEESLNEKIREISQYTSEREITPETVKSYVQDEIQLSKIVEMNSAIYYLESDVTLQPSAVADIDTASCFGFEE